MPWRFFAPRTHATLTDEKPPLQRVKRWLRRFLLFLCLPYVLFCAGMALNQRNMLYVPMPGPSDPGEAGLAHYSAHTMPGPSGDPILYWESDDSATKPLLFYFHGNGGGLFMFVPSLAFLQAQGFHVIAIEYPGYPGAAGSPTQTALLQNAVALYEAKTAAYPNQPAVIWGYSLGTGVASQLAAIHHPKALVLEAPFTAVVDRAQEMFPLLPVPLILQDQYRSYEVITKVGAPLLIIHGGADRIVPLHHGTALFGMAIDPKTLKVYAGAGHLDLQKYGAYDDAAAFLKEHLKK